MRKHMIGFLAVILTFLGAVAILSTASAEEKMHGFVGVGKCKTCHKTDSQGNQYGIWMESRHAKAYETLGGDKAKAIAKEKGIADPQKADECLKCHVTAHGVAADMLGSKYAAEDGVGCESCHGGGADYYKKKTMVAVLTGEIEAKSVGLVLPDEKVCTTCHNSESPTFDSFDFKEMAAKIAHPIPDERKAKYSEGGGGDDDE
jgi:hypothetical protein